MRPCTVSRNCMRTSPCERSASSFPPMTIFGRAAVRPVALSLASISIHPEPHGAMAVVTEHALDLAGGVGGAFAAAIALRVRARALGRGRFRFRLEGEIVDDGGRHDVLL